MEAFYARLAPIIVPLYSHNVVKFSVFFKNITKTEPKWFCFVRKSPSMLPKRDAPSKNCDPVTRGAGRDAEGFVSDVLHHYSQTCGAQLPAALTPGFQEASVALLIRL